MPTWLTVQRATGALLAAITVLVILREWGLWSWAAAIKPWLVLALVTLLTTQVPFARKAFVAVAVALSVTLALTQTGWQGVVIRGLDSAAFIAAFFSALSTLRNVAQTSPAIQKAGRFLSGQKPGRRYAALTLGGQMFALLLNYGAIQLLGSLAMANARSEPNAEIRGHRIRRMLLAIQRAFVSTLTWSPLSFAVAVSITVVPGVSWTQILLPGLVSSALLAGIGWALDSIFKPRLSVVPVRTEPEGDWWTMVPLLILLGLLISSVSVLYVLSGVRVVGMVAVVVPVIAVSWLVIQYWQNRPGRNVAARIREYVFVELPGYRGELTLLMMAAYIGTVGSALLVPVIAQLGIDVAALPTWVILVGFVWIIPLAGQVGMNPILAVTLLAPLIPAASELGVSPITLVVAITAGWAMSGASSPYTATTLLIGSFAGISAVRVGLVWNAAYVALCGTALSVWVLIYGLVL
ncbi:hypothetical protein [Puniceibacterium sp. IMCC21224]|uniref:hypothetical protein n=1 Tax=Puniceibacterium sp. IMCC21224 TaxID=1618204 RepID=UPI00064DC054|nr:hypothetical protein [Puniceibacterium sp. IMCC21224]KMK66215.1 hypothetical protein IMCC21224_111063 [Puniceibacterium sp. IMCC21224]